jgi:hypothetical protein
MRVETLLDGDVVTADGQSASIEFHMPKTIRGIVQYTTTSYSGFTSIVFKLQGRLNAEHDWVDVTDTSKTHTGNATNAAEDITLYPEMRCDYNVTGTGTATCEVSVGS